ncbi:MAG: hypothetical protein ACKV2T_01985 [Kofleriaceae bacterium]
MRVTVIIASLAIVCVLFSVVAADTTSTPWSAGVSEAKKAEANRLLEHGNALFLDKKFSEALGKYREAVTAWDHPAIRFNIVRCLIQLDRAVEAAENLEQALRYGAAPLEDAVYTEARAYEKLLAKQVGDVTIACAQRGVEVSLDGQKLGVCPLRETRRMTPGKHQILGTGGGLLARVTDTFVVGGDAQTVEVSLQPLPSRRGLGARSFGKAAVYAGGGLLAIASGLGLYAWRSYRGQFPEHCMDSPSGGAPLCDEEGADSLDRSRLFGNIATVAGVTGAVAVVTGLVVLWRVPAKEYEAVITPTATGAGVSVRGTF